MTLEEEPPETRSEDHGPDEPERRPRGRRRRPLWFTIPVTVVLGLLLAGVLTPLAVGGRIWYQARQDERPRSDAIIVLGAAQYDGEPSPTLRWRLQHALDLYREGVAPAIVTVGGKAPGDNYTEADSGRTWLVERGGVPAGDVVAVPVGRDTLGSMRAVGEEFDRRGWSTGVIVTDPWHAAAVEEDGPGPRHRGVLVPDPQRPQRADPRHPVQLHRPGDRRLPVVRAAGQERPRAERDHKAHPPRPLRADGAACHPAARPLTLRREARTTERHRARLPWTGT